MLPETKYKTKHGKGLKILTPKQMLQRIPIALAQVKVHKTSQNLLNKICQIIYSLDQAKKKKNSKKVYNNIMNLIKLLNRVNIIFINSESSKTSGIHRLLLNLSDKIDKESDRCVALSNLSIHYKQKNIWKIIQKQ